MSLDVSRHVWVARTDPKRRTWSTASYVHTLGHHGIGYDQPPSRSDSRAQPLRDELASVGRESAKGETEPTQPTAGGVQVAQQRQGRLVDELVEPVASGSVRCPPKV